MSTATAAVLWGMTGDQLADALAPADPTVCAWLDGTCAADPDPDSPLGLCAGHQARVMWRPQLPAGER